MEEREAAGARMAAAAASACAEGRRLISRREAIGMGVGLFSTAFLPRFASAASADPRLLVVVLRGGMDGLNVVVPHGDPAYASMRGSIAIARSATLSLTSFFGLNAALPTFGAMYRRREALAVHAICTPLRNRSHFDTQDNLENGLPDSNANTSGWLNRLLGEMPRGTRISAHGAVQVAEAPLLLRGQAPVLGWAPNSFAHATPAVTDAVSGLLQRGDRQLHTALRAGLRADAIAAGVGGDVGSTPLVRAFRGAGRLMSASNGPRIAVLSVGNFDTHVDQGSVGGFLAGSLGQLDIGLAEFEATARSVWADTVILMVTEFGRTVRINGDGGTDHGVGTVALLAGGAVNGGRVLGDWPGVSQSALFEGSDLRATTDLRALFKGVLLEHVGVPRTLLDTRIFPNSQSVAPMRDLCTTASGSARLDAGAQNPVSASSSAADDNRLLGIARYRAMHKASL